MNPFKTSWKPVGNTTKPSSRLWDEYVNPVTGESTLSVLTPKKVSQFDECDHYYELVSDGNVQCKKCELGHKIAWGIQIIKDGKIITLKR